MISPSEQLGKALRKNVSFLVSRPLLSHPVGESVKMTISELPALREEKQLVYGRNDGQYLMGFR